MKDRIAYDPFQFGNPEDTFYEVIDRATESSTDGCVYCTALEYLNSATYPDDDGIRVGASYKHLALIAHRMDMTKEQRQWWYTVAEQIPLSQSHAGTIIARLNDRDELFKELDQLVASNAR